MASRTALAAVCLLVALAGCNGVVAPDDQPAPTPATVPADRPPGVTATGEVRTIALLENHTATLGDRSVTLRERHVERFANGTLRRNRTTTLYAGRERYYLDERYQGENPWGPSSAAVRYERWGNGSLGVEAVSTGEERRYGVDRATVGPVTRFDRLYLLLSTLDPTVVRDSGDGVVLRATGVTGVDLDDPVEDVRNVTLVARVTGDGLVREYRLTYTGTVDGATVRVTERAAFTDLGRTAAPRPAWVVEAVEQLRLSADGSRG